MTVVGQSGGDEFLRGHGWLNKVRPKTGVCEHCGLTVGTRAPYGTQYAFLHHPGPYTPNIEDYRELCRSCHQKMDAQLRKATGRAKESSIGVDSALILQTPSDATVIEQLAAELTSRVKLGIDFSHIVLTRDDYEQFGYVLGEVHKQVQFAIGDYLNAGVKFFGDDAYQLSESLDIGPSSKEQYMWVASKIEPERRRPELSWSHHRSVAALEPAEQDRWLSDAIENRWSRGDMDERMRPSRQTFRPSLATLTAAARAVYDQADVSDDELAVVPRGTIENLGVALGVVDA